MDFPVKVTMFQELTLNLEAPLIHLPPLTLASIPNREHDPSLPSFPKANKN